LDVESPGRLAAGGKGAVTIAFGRIDPASFVVWALVVLGSIAFVAHRLVRVRASAHAWIVRMFLFAPALWGFHLALFVFVIEGGHPTVQLSGGASWSSWSSAWPTLLLTCLAAGVAALAIGARSSNDPKVPDSDAASWVTIGVADLISLPFVFGNFPSV
jgi:hypothetical protein